MGEGQSIEGVYVNRTTGAVCRVTRVDESYAYLEIIAPAYSRYAMPIAEYDSRFVESWRPAGAEDMPGAAETFRPPKNQTTIVSIED